MTQAKTIISALDVNPAYINLISVVAGQMAGAAYSAALQSGKNNLASATRNQIVDESIKIVDRILELKQIIK